MKEMNYEKRIAKAKLAIEQIARQEGKTVEDIRLSMKEAMIAGLLNPDPKVQATWKSIPCCGEVPTPEELIAWSMEQVENQMKA